MTEAEWLACIDPTPMLASLHGKVSDRKLRLFAVACCRRIWHLLKDERSRKAVEVAEQFSEGITTEEELSLAENDANDVWNEYAYAETDATDAETDASDAACGAACYSEAAISAAQSASRGAAQALSYDGRQIEEQVSQSDLIREIFGNPSRPISADSAWLTSPVMHLARSMYDSRDFSAMPILADALEEAGCDNADVLTHCRGPGSHVRGCWVVDLVLGKA
jgi:hypothetical protein